MKSQILAALVVSFLLAACATEVSKGGGLCAINDDCQRSYFCKKNIGDCDGRGKCEKRPEICPKDAANIDEVLGCDAKVYENACEAHRAGINVKEETP